MLTLTSPWMLLGLGLLALPITAHLLRPRVRRRITLPSIDLLRDSAARRVALSAPMRWLLLLVRSTIVLLLVLAFARPVWSTSAGSGMSDGESDTGEKALAVVFLIDASASSGQRVDGVPTLHRLRARAARAIDTLTPGVDRAGAVIVGAQPIAALPGLTANLDALAQEIAAIEPAPTRADLPAAVAMAGRMLAEHEGPRRLIILSDRQRTNWVPLIDPAVGNPSALPPNTRITIAAPRGAAAPNLGLLSGSVYPDRSRVGQLAEVRTLVGNFGDQPAVAEVELSRRGEPISLRSQRLLPGQRGELRFPVTLRTPGEHRLTLRLVGRDALPADDRRWLIAEAVEQTPVLIIDSESGDLPGSTGFYLSRALAPRGDGSDRFAVDRVTPGQALRRGVSGAGVIVLLSPHLAPAPLWEAIESRVRAGAGLLVCPSANGANGDTASIAGAGAQAWWPMEIRGRWEPSGSAVTLGAGQWEHPIFQRFGPSAWAALRRIPITPRWAGEARPEATTLLLFDNGAPALMSGELGAGRVALANFTLNAERTELGKHGVFVALAQSIVEHLRPERSQRSSGVVGSPLTLEFDLQEGVDAEQLHVRGPDGEAIENARFARSEAGGLAIIPAPSQPGFHAVHGASGVRASVGVNVDPRESDLRRAEPGVLESSLLDNNELASTSVDQAEAGNAMVGDAFWPLWGWAALGALALVGVEAMLTTRGDGGQP